MLTKPAFHDTLRRLFHRAMDEGQYSSIAAERAAGVARELMFDTLMEKSSPLAIANLIVYGLWLNEAPEDEDTRNLRLHMRQLTNPGYFTFAPGDV